jgi:subtilase family serine protease
VRLSGWPSFSCRAIVSVVSYRRRWACCSGPLRGAAAIAAAGTLALAICGCSSGTERASTHRSVASDASADVAECQHQYGSTCYTPQQLRVANGIQPLLDRGIDGRGQTVVIMEFANMPQEISPQITDIRQDLALFDTVFGLPAAKLQVDTTLAGSASRWLAGGEEVEDAEIVHAVAPGAAIRVILIPSWTGPGRWMTALDGVLRLALSQASVVSLSAILGEECFTPAEAAELNSALQADEEHHITVVAGSGDFGAASTQCADFGIPTSVRDQYSGRHLGFVNPASYRIARSASYHQAFHDITSGNSTITFPEGTITGYQATPGWDPVTGWGSPDAQALIPLLARYASLAG